MATTRDHDQRRTLLRAAQRRLTLAHGRDEIIAIVRDAGRAICGADGVTFVLGEGSRCHYADEDAIGPLWKGQRFPMSRCISGWAMLSGETAAVEDIYADARVLHEAYRATFVKSLVMVPVRANGPVAAIGAYWKERRSFTAEDIAPLEALADSVGKAMATAGPA